MTKRSVLNYMGTGTLFEIALPVQKLRRPDFDKGESEKLPATEIKLYVVGEDKQVAALHRAFGLLESLFERDVYDRDVLELILEATGHPKQNSPTEANP